MNVLYLNLSGGEVTTYKNFEGLITFLNKLGMPFYVTTNGIISEKKLSMLLQSNTLMGVKVSLDGISPESYLSIRDPVKKRGKLFDVVLDTLNNLQANGIYTEVATLIHSNNIHEIIHYPEFLHLRGVDKWILGLLIPRGRGVSNEKLLTRGISTILNNNQFRGEVTSKANDFGVSIDWGDIKFNMRGKPIFECGAGLHYMSIQADMNVYPCPLLPYTRFKEKYNVKLKNFRTDLLDVWHSKPFKYWISQQSYGCPLCLLRERCFRCPIQLDLAGIENPYSDLPQCINSNGDCL